MNVRTMVGALCTAGLVLVSVVAAPPKEAAAALHQAWVTDIGVVCIACCFTNWCCDVPQKCDDI
jgi:hypothetical protein